MQNQLFSFSVWLIAFSVCSGNSVQRSKRDVEQEQLTELKLGTQLDQLAQNLQELRSQLSRLSEGSKAADVSNATEGTAKLDQQLSLALKAPRAAPANGIGWQPLKRKLTWQPLKRGLLSPPAGPKFTLRMQDSNDLRSAMIGAVEQHLLDDLAVAQQYGIPPEQILEDLRSKNSNGGE